MLAASPAPPASRRSRHTASIRPPTKGSFATHAGGGGNWSVSNDRLRSVMASALVTMAPMASMKGRMSTSSRAAVITATARDRRFQRRACSFSSTGQVAMATVVAHRVAGKNGRRIQIDSASSVPMNSTERTMRGRSRGVSIEMMGNVRCYVPPCVVESSLNFSRRSVHRSRGWNRGKSLSRASSPVNPGRYRFTGGRLTALDADEVLATVEPLVHRRLGAGGESDDDGMAGDHGSMMLRCLPGWPRRWCRRQRTSALLGSPSGAAGEQPNVAQAGRRIVRELTASTGREAAARGVASKATAGEKCRQKSPEGVRLHAQLRSKAKKYKENRPLEDGSPFAGTMARKC